MLNHLLIVAKVVVVEVENDVDWPMQQEQHLRLIVPSRDENKSIKTILSFLSLFILFSNIAEHECRNILHLYSLELFGSILDNYAYLHDEYDDYATVI